MQSHVNYIEVINNYYLVPNSNVYHKIPKYVELELNQNIKLP